MTACTAKLPGSKTESSGSLHSIPGGVDETLAAATQLKQWWEQTDSENSYAERFPLIRKFNQPESSFGFFDEATIGGERVPVSGVVEEMCYDRPKSQDVERFRDELREFVLQYFLRVSDYRPPAAFTDEASRPPEWLQGLSWCGNDRVQREGFGYSQHYYRLRESQEEGQFPEDAQYRIIDLREIGPKYEWIVVNVRIFDFALRLSPLGAELPQVLVPMTEGTHLILSRDFIVCEDDPPPTADGEKLIGRYGFGYAFVKNPDEGELLSYGPGQFDVAFKQIIFEVREDGEIRVRLAFAANRVRQVVDLSTVPMALGLRIANVFSLGLSSRLFGPVNQWLSRAAAMPFRGFDPVLSSIDLLNVSSGGWARDQLCVSKERLEKIFLTQHFFQHYEMLTGSLLTWRRIPDWLDADSLPDWVKTGVS